MEIFFVGGFYIVCSIPPPAPHSLSDCTITPTVHSRSPEAEGEHEVLCVCTSQSHLWRGNLSTYDQHTAHCIVLLPIPHSQATWREGRLQHGLGTRLNLGLTPLLCNISTQSVSRLKLSVSCLLQAIKHDAISSMLNRLSSLWEEVQAEHLEVATAENKPEIIRGTQHHL